MLITSLMPLLSRYSLGFDLVAGPDDTVTLTVIPRKADGARYNPAGEIRPISITAAPAEIDEELAKGWAGALGQLITARKSLGDQLAEQEAAAKTAAAEAAKAKSKPKTEAAKTPAPAPAPQSEAAAPPPADAKPGEPASLW